MHFQADLFWPECLFQSIAVEHGKSQCLFSTIGSDFPTLACRSSDVNAAGQRVDKHRGMTSYRKTMTNLRARQFETYSKILDNVRFIFFIQGLGINYISVCSSDDDAEDDNGMG
jgi:hypothetical protein